MKKETQQKRRKFNAQEKVKILRLHLLEKKVTSELCDEHNFHPTQFYKWQKIFFENGPQLFKQQSRFQNYYKRKIKELENKLKSKDEVIAEITETLGFVE